MARITLLSMHRNVLSSTQQNLSRVAHFQEQLSSGKRIQRLSDDPISGRRVMVGRIEEFEADRYLSNIDKSLSFMAATDDTMTEMVRLFDATKELAVQGANGTQDANSRAALAQSVDAQLDRLVDLTNSVHDGRFLFAGTASLTKPFEMNGARDNVIYQGDLDTYEVEVGFSAKAVINQDGYELWKDSADIFDTLIELRDALNDNDSQEVSDLIAQVDSVSSHVIGLQGELGGRMQRLELSRGQLEMAKLHLGEIISREEDVDIAATIMEMQSAQVALEAGLQTAMRVIQPSLVDFL
ncbi:MAG: flagellar hook-associated protein FlgL [Planctomycetes bacterium]|nr:flagellar hook-associated protein FlgL [Planctomycetota bacterium]